MVNKYERSWARTRESLAQAAALLPSSVRTDAGLDLAVYQDYLDHNELELAFGILEDCAQNTSVPSAFWHAAFVAAANMGLTSHAALSPYSPDVHCL